MARLTPALQVEVVRRLVDLENTDPESLREIERALEARWSQQFAIERSRDAGPKAVAKILAACDPAIRGQILDNLAAHDQTLAEQFGDAADRLRRTLRISAMRRCWPFIGPPSRKSSGWRFSARRRRCWSGCCGSCRQEEAKRLRHKLDHPGPICLSDVEEARRQIAALAQQISRTNPERAAA